MSEELAGIAEKAASGGFVLFLGNFYSIAISSAGAIVIARLLGPSNYGLLALTFVVPGLLVSLADLGVSPYLIRFPAKLQAGGRHHEAARILRLGFFTKLSTALVVFLLCYWFADSLASLILNRPELSGLLRLASSLIPLQAIFTAATNGLIGMDRMKESAMIQVLLSSSRVLLASVLVVLGFGVIGVLVGHIIASLAAGLIGSFKLLTKYYMPLNPLPGSRDSTTNVRTMINYGLPLHAATLAAVFVTQYQNIVLAYFATNLEIGNFNVALNVATAMSILIYPIATALFQAFSKINPKSQRQELARAFGLSVKYASLAVIPASVLVMTLSGDLVLTVYGRDFSLAPQYVFAYVGLFLLTGGYLVLETFLSGAGDTKTILRIAVLMLTFFVPLAPTMAWLWQIPGLIMALIISNGIALLYGLRKSSKTYGMELEFKSVSRVYVSALLAALPLIIFVGFGSTTNPLANLLIGGSVYLISYLTLAPLLSAVRLADIETLGMIANATPVVKTLAKPILRYEAEILSFMTRW